MGLSYLAGEYTRTMLDFYLMNLVEDVSSMEILECAKRSRKLRRELEEKATKEEMETIQRRIFECKSSIEGAYTSCVNETYELY